jgi:hypothetical protein
MYRNEIQDVGDILGNVIHVISFVASLTLAGLANL